MNDAALTRLGADLERALDRLDEAVALETEDELRIDGTIQRFEFTFELFWKFLRRLLARQGVDIASPRNALRQAYRQSWLDDEAGWLKMLEDRNLASDAFHEPLAHEIYGRLDDHARTMRAAYRRLRTQLTAEG